ncbi:MAG TPA: hypothetical protein VIV11_16705, partial [Kofleriaceae bacterium]
MAKSDSPLVQAATQFDEELAIYARLGELFLKTPLTTLKHLERANQTLGEIADCEQRLSDAGKRLIEALTGARQKQEQLSQSVVDYAPTVQGRNTKLRELMAAMGELATDVQSVNSLVLQKNGDQAADASKPDPGDVSAKVLALSERAEKLADTCREAEFAELAEQAHSLHQRLKA